MEDDRDIMLGVNISEGSDTSKMLIPDAQEFLFGRPVGILLLKREARQSLDSPSMVNRLRGASLISENKLRADAHELGLSILFAFRRRHDEDISSPLFFIDESGFVVETTMAPARGGGGASVMVSSLLVPRGLVEGRVRDGKLVF